MEAETIIDHKVLEVSLSPQTGVQSIEDQKLHPGILVEEMIGVLAAYYFIILPMKNLRRMPLQAKCTKRRTTYKSTKGASISMKVNQGKIQKKKL